MTGNTGPCVSCVVPGAPVTQAGSPIFEIIGVQSGARKQIETLDRYMGRPRTARVTGLKTRMRGLGLDTNKSGLNFCAEMIFEAVL